MSNWKLNLAKKLIESYNHDMPQTNQVKLATSYELIEHIEFQILSTDEGREMMDDFELERDELNEWSKQLFITMDTLNAGDKYVQ